METAVNYKVNGTLTGRLIQLAILNYMLLQGGFICWSIQLTKCYHTYWLQAYSYLYTAMMSGTYLNTKLKEDQIESQSKSNHQQKHQNQHFKIGDDNSG